MGAPLRSRPVEDDACCPNACATSSRIATAANLTTARLLTRAAL
jgi:hypothetical protein